MTIQDVGQVMDILTAFYPGFYSKQTENEKYTAAMLWASVFEPYPAELVIYALKGYIATDEKGFPPVPGQIMAKVRLLTQPQELGEAEAWALVRRACSNGIYGAKKEFDKLPPAVQRLVGGPSQIHEWALMDCRELDSVVASNFQRAYRREVTRQKDLDALPPDVRLIADKLSGRLAAGRAAALPGNGGYLPDR